MKNPYTSIANLIRQKVVSHMPHFYNHASTEQFGRIKVSPTQWYRRLLKLGSYSVFPYVTMSEIEFTVQVDKIPDPLNASHIYTVVERVADNTFRNVGMLDKNKVTIKGRAEYTGDTKFFVGRKDMSPDSSEQRVGITLFSDNVLSMNHYVFGILGVFVSAILSCAVGVFVGLLLGLVKVEPFIQMWIER